jgi:hypothetical protein
MSQPSEASPDQAYRSDHHSKRRYTAFKVALAVALVIIMLLIYESVSLYMSVSAIGSAATEAQHYSQNLRDDVENYDVEAIYMDAMDLNSSVNTMYYQIQSKKWDVAEMFPWWSDDVTMVRGTISSIRDITENALVPTTRELYYVAGSPDSLEGSSAIERTGSIDDLYEAILNSRDVVQDAYDNVMVLPDSHYEEFNRIKTHTITILSSVIEEYDKISPALDTIEAFRSIFSAESSSDLSGLLSTISAGL